MIVCVCNRVSDREILAAAAEGAVSLACLRERLGVASCCGKCGDYAESLLRGPGTLIERTANVAVPVEFYSAA